MKRDLWFFDTECFSNDWLVAAIRQSDGETVTFWNDPEGVQDFVELFSPVLCGYNVAHYDSYILKAILLGWTPPQVHTVSDTIITSELPAVWALFADSPWIDIPPLIDLYHDIVPRKSLKEIEANTGMDIVESRISFDIDRPLTMDEREETEAYCLHDIRAVETLYELRFDYLKAKTDLCEMSGIDPLTMLHRTNARIVSEVLRAAKLPYEALHGSGEVYEVPDDLDRSAVPADVLTFAEGVNVENCESDYGELEFMFHDCPTTVGLGGIHAAVPSYAETATDERVILSQDIGSYYPSLIINNGYMSRAVPDASVYEQFYKMRMEAKRKGDKATAEAAKLVLNTTYGVMKNQHNTMYDPMQATRVCLSGQLYMLDLIEQMYREVPDGLQLIQLNTDGWIISLPRASRKVLDTCVAAWSLRTGFTVDTTEVEKIVQANVNNYVLRTTDGTVKAKGGVVARHKGRDDANWWKSNSATIIDKAVVAYLLDGVPVADTIESCRDIEAFQIVAKAGRTYSHVEGSIEDPVTGMVDTTAHVQRVNRVYATTDERYGGITKVKTEDGEVVRRDKVPLTPERAYIDNENTWSFTRFDLLPLDKSWYIDLAHRKAHEFVTRKKGEREQMADVKEVNNELEKDQQEEEVTTEKKPAPRRRATKKAEESVPVEPLPFKVRLLELQKAMHGISDKVTFDSVVQNINYEYADTQQYKKFLGQACDQLDLIFNLDLESVFLGNIVPDECLKNTKPSYAASVTGLVLIEDVHSDEGMTYAISGFSNNIQAGYAVGGAQTNALRNFILNNFLLDNKGREGDDIQLQADGFVSAEKKEAIKNNIVEGKKTQYAPDLFVKETYKKMMAVRELEGKETMFSKKLSEHFDENGAPKTQKVGNRTLSTWEKTDAVRTLTKAEEILAEAGVE